MLREYRKRLVDLGVTDKEAAVYLALLQNGASTADETAKLANLNRSTTYVQIKTLMHLGLASTFKEGKKTYFAAESPNNLERVLEAKSAELEFRKSQAQMLVPELMNIFTTSGTRPVVRSFEGKEGLASMRNEILDMKDKEFYAATSFSAMLKIFSKKELDAFSKKRAKKGLTSHTIYNYEGPEEKPEGKQRLLQVSEKEFPFSADVYVYDNKVAFAATTGQVVGVIVESASIAQTMRTIFEIIWQAHEGETKI